MSNKRKLKNDPINKWVHLDEGPATCGECGRELHNRLGVTALSVSSAGYTTEGMFEYKCECGCYSFVIPVLETT